MKKILFMSSIALTHGEINEQRAFLAKFLQLYKNGYSVLGFDELNVFFNVNMVRHFAQENFIFNKLLQYGRLDEKFTRIVKDSIEEHEVFLDEFRQLAATADKIKRGEEEITLELLKKYELVAWALTKHAQLEDVVIFEEVAARLGDKICASIDEELKKL
jgi:hemerythrin-like domain-containing protein